MSLVRESPFDKSLWQVDDPAWMKQRKDEWRYVSDNIMKMPSGRPHQEGMKYIKDYFFFAKEDPYYRIQFMLKLWFYPGELEPLYEKLMSNSTAGALDSGRRWFFENASKSKYCTPDGMMRGREKSIARFYFPSSYTDQVIKLMDEQGYEESYRVCPYKPEEFFQEAYSHFHGFIEKYAERNPFTPYQYLIDHWFSCVDHIDSDFLETESFHLLRFFKLVVKFKKPSDSSINAVNATRFVEKFMARMESPSPDEKLIKYWQKAKQG